MFRFAKMKVVIDDFATYKDMPGTTYFYIMKKQHYKNHVRFHAPYHFILLPLLLVCIGITVYQIFHSPFQQMFYIWIAIVLLFQFLTVFLLRQHYSLNNQNRIVRLEMRLRYYQLTNSRFEPLEKRLSFNQIAALRFASDDELLPLIERTLQEKLSPKDIKKSIVHWQGDYMRV